MMWMTFQSAGMTWTYLILSMSTEKMNIGTRCQGELKFNLEKFLNLTFLIFREELVDIQRRVREEKKQLRRTVKEFEDTFKTKTGRKLQKEDREPFEKTYQLYKTTKSKLKLIDALLSKQP